MTAQREKSENLSPWRHWLVHFLRVSLFVGFIQVSPTGLDEGLIGSPLLHGDPLLEYGEFLKRALSAIWMGKKRVSIILRSRS